MIDIVPFTEQLLGAVYEVQLNSSESWSIQQLAEELENSHSVNFCALLDEEVVGYLSAHVIGDECTINNIVVSPTHRSKGVATALLTNTVNKMIDLKVNVVYLEVRTQNIAALALYNKFGFKQVGLRKGFYSNPNDDALLFLKEI